MNLKKPLSALTNWWRFRKEKKSRISQWTGDKQDCICVFNIMSISANQPRGYVICNVGKSRAHGREGEGGYRAKMDGGGELKGNYGWADETTGRKGWAVHCRGGEDWGMERASGQDDLISRRKCCITREYTWEREREREREGVYISNLLFTPTMLKKDSSLLFNRQKDICVDLWCVCVIDNASIQMCNCSLTAQ